MEHSGVFPTTQFACRKCLGTCDALLCVLHTPQRALESGPESWIIQIDYSDAFDWVNNLGIQYKLSSVGIGRSVLSILTQFIKSIVACYGGLLSEYTGQCRVRSATGQGFWHIIVPPVNLWAFYHFGE